MNEVFEQTFHACIWSSDGCVGKARWYYHGAHERVDRPAGHRIARRQPNDRVLEIGFGPGVGIELLADSVSLGKVAGIDPSEEMLEQTKDRNATGIATGRVELLRGSVERLPFEKAMFDKALAINSMQVWPDALAGLQETRRVLKPGGTVLLGFTRYSGQQKEGLTEILMAAGFADVRMVDVDGGFCVFGTNLVGTEEAAI